MPLATDAEIDDRQSGTAAPPAGGAADDVWYHEDEHGWVRQYQSLVGRRRLRDQRGERLLADALALRASTRATGSGSRRRVPIAGGCAAPSRWSTRTRDSCASPATRLASSTSSAVRAPSPSSASTRRSAPGFDEIATVPTFTVTPAMALTHLRLLRGQRLGADDVTLESLALDLLSAALEQHHDGITSYSRRTTGESRRRLVTEACELLHLPDRKVGLVEIARTIGCSPYHLSRVFHEDHRPDDPAISQAAARLRRAAPPQ